jgi:hypothetical protein
MRVAAALTVSLLACAAGAAPAVAQQVDAAAALASFDCRRASEEIERVICSDVRLADADRRVAQAYAAARQRFSGSARQALQQDQQIFNYGREFTFPGDMDNRDALVGNLLAYQTERVDELNQMVPPPGAGLTGRWLSALGQVTVTPVAGARPGMVDVTASTVAPGNARWICDIDIQRGRVTGTGASQSITLNLDGWRITLRRQGQALAVTETRLPGADQVRPFCGNSGSLSGTFFPVPVRQPR